MSDMSVSEEGGNNGGKSNSRGCRSHCQGHTNESSRPGATIAARATVDPPEHSETSLKSCGQRIERAAGDKLGDKCKIMRAKNPECSGENWETSGRQV